MSFSSMEVSNSLGQPILLYEFERDGAFWRYAASDEDITIGGITYVAQAIIHEGITQSGDTTQDEFKISAPLTLPVAQAYNNIPPSTVMNVRVRRTHLGLGEAPVVWVGTLDRVKAINEATAEIFCRNALATLRRGGLRLAWTRGCTHMLYDGQCRVNRASFVRIGIVSAVEPDAVTVPSLGGASPGGVLLGGYAQWTTAAGFTDRRTITADESPVIRLLGGTNGITVGMTMQFYYGCNRTPETCNTIFNNLANYGGFPHLPERSPFDGNPVFT